MIKTTVINMRPETIELLCDPYSRQQLQITENGSGIRLSDGNGRYYPVTDGVVDFLTDTVIIGSNRRYQTMYNRLAPFYDFVTRAAIRLMRSSEEKVRRQYLNELEIKNGARVLEVSVGTGANLRFLPPGADYFGLDISSGQLRQCRRMLKRTCLSAELFLGEAEHLPFKDNSFDSVFHMGGFNYFSDPAAALREMNRVARSGSKIVIVDETERFSRKLARVPIVRAFFAETGVCGSAAAKLIPEKVKDIRLKELFDGRLWCLSFRKA